MFGHKPPPATPPPAPEPTPPLEELARLAADRYAHVPVEDLVKSVQYEATRLFAPAGTTLFPSRHEFNNFAGMVLALCHLVSPPQEDK